jgi:hypothetical protein
MKNAYKILVNGDIVGEYESEGDCLAAALDLRIQASQSRYKGMELAAISDWVNSWPADNILRFTFK